MHQSNNVAMTFREALECGRAKLAEAHTHDPEGCAKFLLWHATDENPDKTAVTNPKKSLPEKSLNLYRTMVDRRLRHEPVWYITNEAFFWRDKFYVDERVLIPRPETELVVEEALRIINRESNTNTHSRIYANRSHSRQFVRNSRRLAVVDVGTGCGAIALSLARELGAGAKIYATDISPDAIASAKENIRRHKMDGTITTLVGDALHPLPEPLDLIVGNPPYIQSGEIGGLSYDIHHFEPRVALDGGPDGLDVHRKIFRQASQGKLKKGGAIALEIGWDQGERVREAAKKYFPEADIRIVKDYAEKDRIVVVTT